MQNLITKPAWTAPHFVFQSVSGPTDLIAPAPAPRLGMEHFVGSSVRVQTTSVTQSMVVPKVQVILYVSLHYLLFSILLSVCFFIIDWIKMRFVLFFSFTEKSKVQFAPTDSNIKPKAYALKAVDTYSQQETTPVVTKYVNITFPHDKIGSIPQKFSMQDNSTLTSVRCNIQEVIWKLPIRYWVVISLIVLFAILATVIGVKMCQRKRYVNFIPIQLLPIILWYIVPILKRSIFLSEIN